MRISLIILELTNISDGSLLTCCRQSSTFTHVTNSYVELDKIRNSWRGFLANSDVVPSCESWVDAWKEFTNSVDSMTIEDTTNSVVYTPVAEYLFNKGYTLNQFWAEFEESSTLGDGKVFINGQYIHCIANTFDIAKQMIEVYYKSLDVGVSVKEALLVKPQTTTNEDLKYLNNPREILGFEQGVVVKTENAQRVLQLMDSEEDGSQKYSEFVVQVSNDAGITKEHLEIELEPFV